MITDKGQPIECPMCRGGGYRLGRECGTCGGRCDVFPQTVTALAEITAERRRQIEAEGWTPEHDDQHGNGALAAAAACYAIKASRPVNDGRFGQGYPPPFWPGWATKWWKPKDPRSDLVRAAALIVAEIERLDRLSQTSGPAPSVEDLDAGR